MPAEMGAEIQDMRHQNPPLFISELSLNFL